MTAVGEEFLKTEAIEDENDQRIYIDEEYGVEPKVFDNSPNFELMDANFPFFACLSVVLIFLFFYVKFYKNRTKSRNKRSNYKK